MIFPLHSVLGPLGRKYGGGLWSGWAGIQHCWHYEETSDTRYDVVGAAHLTDVNTVGYTAGKNGNAANLIADNNEDLTKTAFTLPAEFTIAQWLNLISGDTYTFSLMYPWTYGVQFRWIGGSSQAYILVGNAGGSDGLYVDGITAGWHLFLLTFDASFIPRAYVDNGTPTVGAALTGVPTGGQDLHIGYCQSFGTYSTFVADETLVWNRVVDEDTRTGLWNSGAGRFYPD